ncbi:MAG: class I SAM-dependent methyltransferase [Candidatus Thiodiazotropha weberae]|nr:class I SAM-dependent methyltransferase [Candidatus Thiodiazotropha lotti]MCG8012126.1 class I SAM-dependent methyltransferase [Candidatus Thiodiazotropha lotti]MCG8019066.1 class I SAM-dependent methyltransferase [Candidatus Thiodiazotropha lotti]MCW4206224.1 class I SAM-dependent methyltransferase [Candidatus Thiodiazotropha lotti]MCW4211594.1 class I SAM-dependent methyltransferase [Candidatus Thiodiazotropha lotti]
MKLKVCLKSRAADRVLAPLRKELLELIDHGSSIIEIGCGTGDLIFQSASKIRSGYGVDLDRDMINYAEGKRREKELDHITFECINALNLSNLKYDIATSTLCLHELCEKDACKLLRMMVDVSKKVLIADYTKANSFSGKLGIGIDELFSGHYGNYKRYRRNGEIPSYVSKIGAKIISVQASTVDGITIWVISDKINA